MDTPVFFAHFIMPLAPLQRCGTPSSSAALLSSFLHRMRRKGALAGLEADPIVGLPAAAASYALPATDGSPAPSAVPVAVLPGSAAQAALGPLVRWVTGQELLAEMLDQVGQCCNELNPNSFLGASSLYRYVFISPARQYGTHNATSLLNVEIRIPHYSCHFSHIDSPCSLQLKRFYWSWDWPLGAASGFDACARSLLGESGRAGLVNAAVGVMQVRSISQVLNPKPRNLHPKT